MPARVIDSLASVVLLHAPEQLHRLASSLEVVAVARPQPGIDQIHSDISFRRRELVSWERNVLDVCFRHRYSTTLSELANAASRSKMRHAYILRAEAMGSDMYFKVLADWAKATQSGLLLQLWRHFALLSRRRRIHLQIASNLEALFMSTIQLHAFSIREVCTILPSSVTNVAEILHVASTSEQATDDGGLLSVGSSSASVHLIAETDLAVVILSLLLNGTNLDSIWQ